MSSPAHSHLQPAVSVLHPQRSVPPTISNLHDGIVPISPKTSTTSNRNKLSDQRLLLIPAQLVGTVLSSGPEFGTPVAVGDWQARRDSNKETKRPWFRSNAWNKVQHAGELAEDCFQQTRHILYLCAVTANFHTGSDYDGNGSR
jgi:hypothetical protein